VAHIQVYSNRSMNDDDGAKDDNISIDTVVIDSTPIDAGDDTDNIGSFRTLTGADSDSGDNTDDNTGGSNFNSRD